MRHYATILFALLTGLSSCGTKDPKFQQYYVQGEQLYLKHCSNCHQRDGSGLGLLYPPINGSDFLKGNLNEVMCMMKKGRSGELVVNGKTYNQPMPGNPLLSDLEVAEITTYIYNTWGAEQGLISVQQASAVIEGCR